MTERERMLTTTETKTVYSLEDLSDHIMNGWTVVSIPCGEDTWELERACFVPVDEELVRLGRKIVQARFLGWRVPAIELPPDSVIDAAVADIIRIAIHSEV